MNLSVHVDAIAEEPIRQDAQILKFYFSKTKTNLPHRS